MPTARRACLGSLAFIWTYCLVLRDPTTLVPLNSDSSRELPPQFRSRGPHFQSVDRSFSEGVFSHHIFFCSKTNEFLRIRWRKGVKTGDFWTSKLWKVGTSLTESLFLAFDRAKNVRKSMTSRPESPSEFSKVRTYRTESLFLSFDRFLEGIPFGRSSLCSLSMFKNPLVFAHLIDRMCKNRGVFEHRKARRRGPLERNPSF